MVNDSGAITIARDLIVGNSVATGDGGGLWNDGQMTVNDSEIADNTARDHGAGVTNAQGGKATFNQSTIRNNRAGLQAGGIYNVNADSTVVLNVSRVVKNSSANAPGGVYNGAGSVVVNKRSTIAENTPPTAPAARLPYPAAPTERRNGSGSRPTAVTPLASAPAYGSPSPTGLVRVCPVPPGAMTDTTAAPEPLPAH